MDLATIIKTFLDENNMTGREFHKRCGNISYAYIANIINGKNYTTGKAPRVSEDKLAAIAQGLGLPLSDLKSMLGIRPAVKSPFFTAPTPTPIIDADRLEIDKFNRRMAEKIAAQAVKPSNAIPYTPARAMVPIVGSVRCGPGGLAYQELQGSELADVANPSEYFYLRAEGDSMLPDIRPGDLVLVHIQPEVDSGQLAVVTIDGDSEEGALKKYILKDNALILQSFNQTYPPRVFVGEEMTAVHVCGRVVETKRKW